MIKRIILAVVIFSFCIPIVSHAQDIQFFKEPPFEHYKVSRGDTFWFIAKRYGLDYRELMRLNAEIEPRNMQIGEVIRLKAAAEHSSTFEEQVATLVNKERGKAGLSPLTHRADLKNVAHKKAEDMINSNYFAHNSPNYGSPFQMLKTFGISYQAAGENIAKGQSSPEAVMNSWMNSTGHRDNILNGQYNTIGVGFYNGAWVQIFIKTR